MDRIDPAYYAHSSRVDLNDETRVNATNDEAEEWRKQNEAISGKTRSMSDVSMRGCCSPTAFLSAAPPNFISDVFYLTLAANHIGQMKLVNNVEDLNRQYDDVRRHLEVLQSDQSWRGVRFSILSQPMEC